MNPTVRTALLSVLKYGSLAIATKYGIDASASADVIDVVSSIMGLGVASAITTRQNVPDVIPVEVAEVVEPTGFTLSKRSRKALTDASFNQADINNIGMALYDSEVDFGFATVDGSCYLTSKGSAIICINRLMMCQNVKQTVFGGSVIIAPVVGSVVNPIIGGV